MPSRSRRSEREGPGGVQKDNTGPTIAQLVVKAAGTYDVVATCFPEGYLVKSDDSRVQIPRPLHQRRRLNSDGRCVEAVYTYPDRSSIAYLWSPTQGAMVTLVERSDSEERAPTSGSHNPES